MRRLRQVLFGAIRTRATVVSIVIVALALGISAFGTVELLGSSLDANAANNAKSAALDIASFASSRNHPHSHLPISSETMAAQIIGPRGTVLASSRNIEGAPRMASLVPGLGRVMTSGPVVLHLRRNSRVNLDLDSHFVVAAVGLGRTAPGDVALAASSLGSADHAVTLVSLAFAVVGSLLLLLVGLLVWRFVGRALDPVELIRAEVAELSATDLARRVPEPETRDEIGRLATTMNAMLARLESSSARQRQLVADVSHELRNPLASLRTQLEVATALPASDHHDLLAGSIEEVNRLSRLVADLLTLARFDEHSVELRLEEVDLDETVLAVAEQLRASTPIEVSTQGVHAARVAGDPEQLYRLVANLAHNAARHATGRVMFAVASDGAVARLSVADDGAGIPPHQRKQVFERFVRLDDARTKHDGGAGLGLAIAREIARVHAGDITVEDARPGARFVVVLPLAAIGIGVGASDERLHA